MTIIRGGEAQPGYRIFRQWKVRLGLSVNNWHLTLFSLECTPQLYVDPEGTVNMTSAMVATKP